MPMPFSMSTTSSLSGSRSPSERGWPGWPSSDNSTTRAIASNSLVVFTPPTPLANPPRSWIPPPGGPPSTIPDLDGTTVVDDRPQASGTKVKPSPTKWFLAGVIVALVVVIAILGGVFGSRLGKVSSSSSGDDSAVTTSTTLNQGRPTSFPASPGGSGGATLTSQSGSRPTFESKSVCYGKVCPVILSVAQFASPPTAFVFGRGHDNAVWYRQTNGEKWLSNWESLGGDMLSQPAAASIDNNLVDLFVYARNNTIQTKRYHAGSWNDTWSELGLAVTSPPYTRACSNQQVDVVVRGTRGELQRRYYQPCCGWSAWQNNGGGLSSFPVLHCSGNVWRLAVLGWQGARQPLYFMTWLGVWSGWELAGGDFRGSLAVAARNSEESLTFGITVNSTMQYHHWIRTSNVPYKLEELGGSFQSTPVVLVTSVDRLDVLAVGRDDRLKHRALIGSTWSPDWQDLGGAFNSTPAILSLVPGKVSVYGLGVNGTMFHGTWSITKAFDWSDGPDWLSDGGSLTLEGFSPY